MARGAAAAIDHSIGGPNYVGQMGALLVSVLPLAVGAAISPTLLALQLLVLTGATKPRARAWALAAGMETDEARTFVDPALPKALTELAAAGDHPTEVMTAGQDLRAADIVSSSNNIFSSLGEMVLAKSKPAKDAFDRGVIKGFEKVGENVVVYAANLLGYGAAATIMALFPEFAWVVALAVFAKAVASAMGK